jgi:hypothetical protein
MYIPLVADLLIKNKDKILPSGNDLNFKGIMIGNGVMLTDLHWRREARNKFYTRHYHVGTEIQALISQCKYNASDSDNYVCQMGNKLVDQVSSFPISANPKNQPLQLHRHMLRQPHRWKDQQKTLV